MPVQFGKVYKAVYAEKDSKPQEVAVKILRTRATLVDKEDFLNEVEIMLSLDHPNFVKVVGVVIARKPWLLVLEYLKYKDLGSVLRACKKARVQLRIHEMINFAVQISAGCAYLEKV